MPVHFFPIKIGMTLEQLAELYSREIVRLHGVPIFIVFNQGVHCMGQTFPISRICLQQQLSSKHPDGPLTRPCVGGSGDHRFVRTVLEKGGY